MAGSFRRGRVAAVVAMVGLVSLSGCNLGEPPTPFATHGPTVGVADVDGDGDRDVVTAGGVEHPGRFTALLNRGHGTFDAVELHHSSDCQPGSGGGGTVTCLPPEVVDLDGRWILVRSVRNLATEGSSVDEVTVQLRGGGSDVGYSSPVTVDHQLPPSTEWRLADVATAEHPGGGPDVIAVDTQPTGGGSIRVWPNIGPAWGVAPPIVTPVPPGPVFYDADDIAFPDLDGDENLDLVLAGMCVGGGGEALLQGCLAVARGDGTGAFSSPDLYRTGDDRIDAFSAVAAGDVDQDGHIDVLTANGGANLDGGGPVASLSLLRGDGAGGLAAPEAVPTAAPTVGVQLGEFDGDGFLDLLTATVNMNDPGVHDWGHVLFGDGSGGFGDEHLLPGGHGVVADLDADGRSDFVRSTGRTPSVEEVYLNRWDGRPED